LARWAFLFLEGKMEQSPLRPPIASRGIVPILNASQVVAQEQEAAKKRLALSQPTSRDPFIDSLAGHIKDCWYRAKQAKDLIEQEMLLAVHQRNGVYENDKLQAIRQMGGSEVYVMLTATKCRAAEAWINETLRPASEWPFTIDPTPLPELPPELEDSIKQEVIAVSEEVIMQAAMAGQQFQDSELIRELREYAKGRKDAVLEELRDEAKKRSERMFRKIADQLAQGGWINAFAAVVSDFTTMKAAILKGPVIRRRKVQKWVKDPQARGGWSVKATDELVPEFDRVSPFDLYPAPDSRSPDDGYLIERHKLSRRDLQALIGVPGYSDEKIKAVIRNYGVSGLVTNVGIDSSRNAIEFGGKTDPDSRGDKIEALEYWGSASGQMLKEWGVKGDLDPDLEYEVNAWLVGDYVIRAILNPDQLGRKPYAVDSFERIPGSFWGRGIPDLMRDLQDICNAVARAIVNNSQLASGPQVEVNVDRVETAEDEQLFPWKIWQSDNKQMSEGPAVRFTQPTMVVEQLLRVFEFFAALTEDQTGIPRWAHGRTNIGGAGETSSGLSMLMTHASRGIKEAIAHLDNMIAGCIERVYDYNMAYDEDEDLKGDSRVIARGVHSLTTKEQQLVRTREFLASILNPVDMEIIGIEGRARLLKEAMKGLDLDVEDIIPDDDGLKKLVAKIEQKQMMMAQMGQQQGQGGMGVVPSPAGQSLDAAGNPAGGVENNLNQNPAGQTPGLRAVPTT
jgi:hypothetical protein